MISQLRKYSVLLLIILLSGCGGGSSDSGDAGGGMAPERPEGVIEGRVFLDAVKDSSVIVYDFTGGAKGTELGRTTTNNKGDYSLRVRSDDVDILVEATGGSYVEESTGVTVSLDSSVIRAVYRYVSGNAHLVNVTHFTNIASGYSQYLINTGIGVSTSIANANVKFSAIVGFDILATTPLSVIDVSNTSSTLNDGQRYGYLHAGISELMKNVSEANSILPHTLYNSAVYSQAAYDDILDGIFDGISEGQQLSFGTVELSHNYYRNGVTLSMFDFVQSVENVVGFSGTDISVFARRINDTVDEVYGGAPVVNLDDTAPSIQSFNIAEGDLLYGNVPLLVNASDAVGIDKIFVDIGGVASLNLVNGQNAYFDTTGTNTPDNNYLITVTAYNNLGVSASLTRNVHIVNSLGTVAGRVFLDAVNNSTVVAYDFTGGVKGEELGRTSTNNEGDYTLRLRSDNAELLLEASGGSYVEESTGVTVTLNSSIIRAVHRYTSGNVHRVNITHYTNIACGYAQHLIANGGSVPTSITNANAKFSNIIGFDVISTTPLSVADSINAAATLNDGLSYGFLHAGISDLMKNVSELNGASHHALYNSVMYSEMAYQDIQDGVFDGQSDGQQLAFGTVEITTDKYRYDVAISMFNYVLSEQNVVGMSGTDISILARNINESIDEVYGGATIVDLDGAGPSIQSFNIADGALLYGNTPFLVMAFDIVGIDRIVIDVGGITTMNVINGQFSYLDTRGAETPDNNYLITVTVYNNLGESVSLIRHVRIINTQGTISGAVMSPPLVSGTVSVYDYTGLVKGELLGTATTDSQGEYSLSIRSFDVPLLVVASGGSYSEPSSSVNIPLTAEQSFSAAVNYEGRDTTIALTPYTTFAHAKAHYLAWLGMQEPAAITTANSQFNSITGVNVIGTTPIDVHSSDSYSFTLTERHKYGLLIAAISQWTLDETQRLSLPPHQIYNIAEFTRLGYDDIRADGEYGEAGSAKIMIGSTYMLEEVYRHELAVDAMQFVNSNKNATGLNSSAVYGFLQDYNNNVDTMYGGESIIPLNEGNPSILSFNPTSGTSKNGTFTFSATVQDLIGLSTGKLYMDGAEISTFIINKDQLQTVVSEPIDTAPGGDTQHTFNMVFTNAVGESIETGEITIQYDNVPPIYYHCGGSVAAIQAITGGPACFTSNWNNTTKTCTIVRMFEEPYGINSTLGNESGVYKGTTGATGVYTYQVPMGTSICKKLPFRATDFAGNEFVPRSTFVGTGSRTDGWYDQWIYLNNGACESTIAEYVGSVTQCNGVR